MPLVVAVGSQAATGCTVTWMLLWPEHDQNIIEAAGDTAVARAKNIFRPEQIELSGGGGTDMAALIVAAAEERPAPKAILVVTDGYTDWPCEPVGPRVVACLTQARTAEHVPEWIDTVVLSPEK